MKKLRVIDSHTGGEPTRVVVEGGPELGSGSVAERMARLRDEHDRYRRAVVNEPRGNDVMVGALLVPPVDPTAATGVIFFNNVGYLGMCGHGTIGVVAVLEYLGLAQPGPQRIETPVGTVTATLLGSGEVRVENVASYRYRPDVSLEVEGLGTVRGDVAWGGNWFFLVTSLSVELHVSEAARWTAVATQIREALLRDGVTAQDGAEIDHIEIFGPALLGGDSRSFVLCPGMAYDRSPCGTGTSAKLACLAADGKLAPGATWRQESIVGSEFQASFRWDGNRVLPSITGKAFVNADAWLLLDPRDPFCWGIGH